MAGWADMTLGEFDALEVLRGDALELLNRYWDWLHVSPANVFRGDEPTRLTDDGVVWAGELQARLHALDTSGGGYGVDKTPWRELARELISGVGVFAVGNAARIARGESLR